MKIGFPLHSHFSSFSTVPANTYSSYHSRPRYRKIQISLSNLRNRPLSALCPHNSVHSPLGCLAPIRSLKLKRSIGVGDTPHPPRFVSCADYVDYVYPGLIFTATRHSPPLINAQPLRSVDFPSPALPPLHTVTTASSSKCGLCFPSRDSFRLNSGFATIALSPSLA